MTETRCICGYITVGRNRTQHKNWHPDCPEHGVDSAWYASPEQVAKREEQSRRQRDLYAQAARARAANA